MDQRQMEDPLSSGPKMVPDLIRLDNIDPNFLQHVETDLLETSTFQEATASSTGFASFNLAQKGFLHSHSKVLVGLVPGAATQFLPTNIGIASIIDRAVLKVRKSGQVINDISDFGHFHAIKSAQISNETNREREQFMTGRIMNKEFKHYFDDGAGTGYDTDLSLGYGLDNGREYDQGAGAGVRNTSQKGKIQPFAIMNNGAPAESPTYSIDISDLFLFMKTQSLPLYMIDQGLTIELFWSRTTTDRVCAGVLGDIGNPAVIDQNELKLVADYITYTEDDAMNRYRDANPVIDLSFSDYRLSKNSRQQSEILTGFVRQLGMNNRVVPRVVTTLSIDGQSVTDPDPAPVLPRQVRSAFQDGSLVNKYNMQAPDELQFRLADGEGQQLSYNIRYKSRFEFSQPLTNKSQAFTQFVQSEGLPFVSRQEYSRDQGGYLMGRNPGAAFVPTTPVEFEDYLQTNALAGNFFMLGTRLTNGRVGNDGIELHLSGIFPDSLPDRLAGVNVPGSTHYVVRTYCEYVRRARLENGEMQIYNA